MKPVTSNNSNSTTAVSALTTVFQRFHSDFYKILESRDVSIDTIFRLVLASAGYMSIVDPFDKNNDNEDLRVSTHHLLVTALENGELASVTIVMNLFSSFESDGLAANYADKRTSFIRNFVERDYALAADDLLDIMIDHYVAHNDTIEYPSPDSLDYEFFAQISDTIKECLANALCETARLCVSRDSISHSIVNLQHILWNL